MRRRREGGVERDREKETEKVCGEGRERDKLTFPG
jgi:hypothetical protein